MDVYILGRYLIEDNNELMNAAGNLLISCIMNKEFNSEDHVKRLK